MVALFLAGLLVADLTTPPKQPDLGFAWISIDLRGANEVKIRPERFREPPRWVRLFGIDVPNASQRGYSAARQALEILMRDLAWVYFEDDDDKHPINRNSSYVQYLWTSGKLVQFEFVRDGLASVNQEGRKGRYGKFLIAAEAEAKRFHEGIWSVK